MAQLHFAVQLARLTDCPPANLAGATVAEVLSCYFAQQPQLRGYVLDDQGAVRRHVMILIDGRALRDRRQQSDALHEDSELWILPALSGG